MDQLHLIGGRPDSKTTVILQMNRMRTGRKLKAPEFRGCSVAVSPFEVVTIHGTMEKNYRRKIRVYRYNMMTGGAKYYKTKIQPDAVSVFMDTCVKIC